MGKKISVFVNKMDNFHVAARSNADPD